MTSSPLAASLPSETKICNYKANQTVNWKTLDFKWRSLGETWALATNQSVDCHATTLFTAGLNSAKV